MKDDRIKKSVDKIEPRPDAENRMYLNILAKAEKKRKRSGAVRFIRMAIPVAACLCVAILGVFHLSTADSPVTGSEDLNPPFWEGSPYEAVSSAKDFESIGITLEAPPDAESVAYSLFDREIACIDFLIDGKAYTLMASAQSGDFSGIYGEVVRSEQLDSKLSAVLEVVDCAQAICYRIHWTDGKTNYILYNTDGASESSFLSLFRRIIAED